MDAQQILIKMRQFVKNEKECILQYQKGIKSWQSQPEKSPVFIDLKKHMIQSLRNNIQSSREAIKAYNQIIQKHLAA